MNSNSLLISTLLAILTTVVNCTTITIYEDAGRTSVPTFLWWGGGVSHQYTLEQDSCITFNYFDNKISSIDPHGGCVRIWEEKNCAGDSMVVTDRTGCSKNLADCSISGGGNWDNKMSSMTSCSSEEESRISIRVKICKQTNCEGDESYEIKAKQGSCTNFGENWAGQVNAIKIKWYDCVTMFDVRDCSGHWQKFCAVYLYEANPCKPDLSRCGWSNRIRSMKTEWGT